MIKGKVFFVLSTDDYSGAEIVNRRIIEALKYKYDMYWVSKSGNINGYLNEYGIRWVEISDLSIKEIKRVSSIYNPDILHATDYKASVICAAAHTNAKLICHLHNNSPWLKRVNINSFLFLYAGLKADRVLTVSNSIKNEYIFSDFFKHKMECIGNPVSRDEILYKVDECNDKKLFDVCCVGRIEEQKNPLKFLKIIKELYKTKPDLRACWVGDGSLMQECKDFINKEGLENIIEFLGFKKNPYEIMKQAKVFMLTSEWEGFGLVAFEALCLGLPCIVSNVGGLSGVVDDSCGYLCLSNQEFLDAAKRILSDEALYTRMSSAANEKAKCLDNIEVYMKTVSKIYDELLRGRH